jgi:peptidoglycan/xylan/chitin deacetylase (PgdA/CDA1 family)
MINRKLKSLILRPFISAVPAKKGLVVLTLHNLLPDEYHWFEFLLSSLKETYEFVNPEELNCTQLATNKLKILLTFDDGFYSSFDVTQKYLQKYKIKAIFFITEDFINLDAESSLGFANKSFFPKSLVDYDNKLNYLPMNWDEIMQLKAQGHTIGAHTAKHPVLSEIKNEGILFDEIVSSSDRLEERIGEKVDFFAFPFGTPQSVNKQALKLASKRFKFIFSNVRGSVINSPNEKFIFRQNLVPGDPFWLVKTMIEGRWDWKYKKLQQESHKLCREIKD